MAARRVRLASDIANLVVSRRKRQHVLFSLVLDIESVTALAMVVFMRADVVPGFLNDNLRLIVTGER
jgi:hypothetical protein